MASFLAPGPAYIPPSSGFFFGHFASQQTLLHFLPSRVAADRLMGQYYEVVHPMCRIVHWPSFEHQYEVFWNDILAGIEPTFSLQAICFAAMFSAVVSMSEDTILQDFGVSRSSMVENFQLGTETALSRAKFLRSTKIETLQALVMYMVSLVLHQHILRSPSLLLTWKDAYVP